MNPILDEEASEAKNESEKLQEKLKNARERYKLAEEYWSDDREAALDDIKFRAGNQWPEDIASKRSTDNRPCLTVDKVSQYVRQIVNDGRQNRPSVKVRPVDSGADVATANVFQGIVKHIEERSGADAAYDTALDSAATCGFGYFRVLTEYAGEETFDQEICIERVRNPLSVMIDPMSQKADGSDMKFCFVTEMMSKEDFEAKYPNKTPDDFETNESYSGWYGDEVRVCEYWYIEEEERTLFLMADNSVISMAKYDELKEGGLIEIDSMVKEKRNIPVKKVYHCMVSGKEFLTEPKEWYGKYIPVLVVWGNEYDIEGKVAHCGIIRPAKDAQRLYNYSRSAFAERVALTPKAPWLAAEGQVEDYENEWKTANTANHSVLRYKPTSLNGTPVPPPSRINPSDVPMGFSQDMQMSEHDIQGAIGMYNASLGAPSNERSGKAIMARQREGDVGTFHYHDNLNRAIRHCGRILIDLIPKIYDSTRVVRILGYDGTPDEAELDPNLPTASQQMGVKTLYNLSVGTYDVTTSTGPSYTTLRQEAAESMTQMIQAAPELMGVIGDLMVKNMDWPGADEIAERLKLTLPPQILQAEQEKKQNGNSEVKAAVNQVKQQYEEMANQVADQVEQLNAEMQKLQQENQALKGSNEAAMQANEIKSGEVQIKSAEVQIKEMEVQIKAQELQIKQFEAETDRLKVQEEIRLREMEIQSNLQQAMISAESEHMKCQMDAHESDKQRDTDLMVAMATPANAAPQAAGY